MAYKFQRGDAQLSGSVTIEEDLTVTEDVTVSDGDVTISSGDVTISSGDLTISELTSGRLPLVSTSGLFADSGDFVWSDARALSGYNYIAVSSSASGSAYVGDGLLYVSDSAEEDVFVVTSNSFDFGSNGDEEAAFSVSNVGGDAGSVSLYTDDASIYFGADQDVALLHVPDTGLRLENAMGLSLREGGININSDATGYLDIAAGTAARFSTEIHSTGMISSSAQISGSSFWGDGAGLTNISSDNVDVADSSANSEFRLVGVAASGDGVSLTCMDTAADHITMNASTGKLTLAGSDSGGALELSAGNLNMGSGTSIVGDGDLSIDFTNISDDEGDILLKASLNNALEIKQAGNSYLKFNTSAQQLEFGQESYYNGYSLFDLANITGQNDNGLVIRTLGSGSNLQLKGSGSDGVTITAVDAFLRDKGLSLSASNDSNEVYLGVNISGADDRDLMKFGEDAITIAGSITATGDATLGDSSVDNTTVNGSLTGSHGALFSADVSIPNSAHVHFNGHGSNMKIGANGGNDLNFNANNNFVFNPGGHVVQGDTDNTVDLGATGAQWKDLYLGGAIHGEEAAEGALAINMPDNMNEGFMIRVNGDSNWMTFKTTNSAEAIQMNKDVTMDDGTNLGFAGDGNLSFGNSTTGNSTIKLTDNLAEALKFRQGGNAYLTFVTTDGDEAVQANKDLMVGAAIGDETFLTLNGGVEYRGQALVTGNKTLSDIYCSHYMISGSAATTLTLPAASNGLSLYVKRSPLMTGGNAIIDANGSETIDGDLNIALETVGASVMLVASGSSWYVY
tara:strand:+ start:28 stop:2415 length:2388 start_codon:yes stop_codon:yes gene_type:complete